MIKRKEEIEMTNFAYQRIQSEQILSNTIKKNSLTVKWVYEIPELYRVIPVDEFHYPPLNELRLEFESSGLYTDEQINQIMKSYERLPKYKAKGSSAPRSKKRG